MATMPPPKVDPRTVVKISSRLWSEEVGLADANDVIKPFDPAYRFSNGKEFVEKKHYQDDLP